MVTYVQKDINSDISPSWPNTTEFDLEMSAGLGIDSSIQFTIAASTVISASFITLANKPNNGAFQDGGTQTVEIEVQTAAMNIRMRCRMVKLDSSGTIIGVKGAFTGFQTLQADRTFSPVSPTWTGTEACTHRLAVELELENVDTMMSSTAAIGLGTAINEVITDITENSGGCSAPGGFAHSQVVTVG